MTTTTLDSLDSLPAAYYRGRHEYRRGRMVDRHFGESEEDWDARYCGWFDEALNISPAERVEIERKGEDV